MKKIILILMVCLMLSVGIFVLADNSTSTKNKNKNNVVADPICAKTSVDKRDTAIIAAFDSYSTAVKTALTARKDSLKAAWDITDKQARKEAIKTAWKNYSTALRTARTTFSKARKTSWQQYGVDRRSCGSIMEDQMNSGIDATL